MPTSNLRVPSAGHTGVDQIEFMGCHKVSTYMSHVGVHDSIPQFNRGFDNSEVALRRKPWCLFVGGMARCIGIVSDLNSCTPLLCTRRIQRFGQVSKSCSMCWYCMHRLVCPCHTLRTGYVHMFCTCFSAALKQHETVTAGELGYSCRMCLRMPHAVRSVALFHPWCTPCKLHFDGG